MRKMMHIVTATVLALTLIYTPVFAANEATPSLAEKKAELEKKYSISITYPVDGQKKPQITLNTLLTLDTALENVTPTVVKQVSQYYKEKNGSRLNFSFVRSGSLDEGSEAILAAFDNNSSQIELYIPRSSGNTIASGEAPLSIVHEFGHALHLMYTDKYGDSKMRSQWQAFNGKSGYDPENIASNPNSKVFVSGYAATSYHEDVAETLAHVFIRHQPGQGFSGKLSTDGKPTGLGKKVAYVEKMLSAYLTNTDQAVKNYRRIYSTQNSTTYQGMIFSGEHLQYAGYAQPRYILNGTLNSLGKTKGNATWIRSLGGWYVKEDGGNQIIVFPGGVWTEVISSFQAPKSAA